MGARARQTSPPRGKAARTGAGLMAEPKPVTYRRAPHAPHAPYAQTVVPIILSGAAKSAARITMRRWPSWIAPRAATRQEWSERPFQAASNMMGRIGRFAFHI